MGGYLYLEFMKLWYNSLFILGQLVFGFSIKMGNHFEDFKKNKEKSFEIIVDSKKREYYLHVPDNHPNNAPLLFVFHGYSGNALNTIQTTNFNKLADKNGFIVCYPQGLIDKENNAFWQVGYNFHKDYDVDDVKFITELIEKLQTEFELSKTNVFMTGFSNGGDFCNLLSCETDGLFKAIAPIISCFMEEFYNNCHLARAIPTFMLNGTRDSITFWDGDMNDSQGYGPYLPTKAMINFRLNQIQYDKLIRDTVKSTNSNENTLVAIEKYSSTKSNNQVWMYTYLNGGHGYPDYLNLEEQIWSFFSLYLK